MTPMQSYANLLKPENSISPGELKEIKWRLDRYYNNVNGYPAFLAPSSQDHCWFHLGVEIRRRITKVAKDEKIRVLEIGAGKSGFGLWLTNQGLRNSVYWAAQDVTEQNVVWLKEQCNKVTVGDVNDIKEINSFDLVFSTYVLEHVTEPTKHLDCLYKLLFNGGSLFIFSPRYDFPGYLCPSIRHVSAIGRFSVLAKQQWYRAKSFYYKKPSFLIQSDLAAFNGPFFTDCDAVHWVSLADLKYWAKYSNSTFLILRLSTSKFGGKDWIVKRLLTCAVEIRKGN